MLVLTPDNQVESNGDAVHLGLHSTGVLPRMPQLDISNHNISCRVLLPFNRHKNARINTHRILLVCRCYNSTNNGPFPGMWECNKSKKAHAYVCMLNNKSIIPNAFTPHSMTQPDSWAQIQLLSQRKYRNTTFQVA